MFSCKLKDCPPGLLLYQGNLCFKSEYSTLNKTTDNYQVDAYVVESGEYFHGNKNDGVESREDRIVTPVEICDQLNVSIRSFNVPEN